MANRFADSYNAKVGAVITVLTAIFGSYWYLFAVFLLFNVLDWLTGWHKARIQKIESSSVGLQGALKKLGYWIIILISFVVPIAFMNLGQKLGMNLSFLEFLGWFVLASLLVNEARSILENLVATGHHVPLVLIKGLAITDKVIGAKASQSDPVQDDLNEK